ncbi:hypothetical protein LTR95_013462 [Oleoguttula sp. CCFEE 5521]
MAQFSIYAIKLEGLASTILDFIKENPRVTGLVIIGGLMFLCPQVVTAPALKLFGFTATGPAAGSLAAEWQAVCGVVPAAGKFATAQSAAMSGYGLSVVNGVVQGIAMVDLMMLVLGKGLLGEREQEPLKSKL